MSTPTTTPEPGIPPIAPPPQDLGFGAVVGRERERRLLNRDGTFNVRRAGLSLRATFSPYHVMLSISWPRFIALVVAGFAVANVAFALAYMACGPGALHGSDDGTGPFWRAFFFSVHTLGTIGYGNVTPTGMAANLIVAVEALSGLLGLALVTGVLFARFARPMARIRFSHGAVIAPYRGTSAFMFRIANARRNELFELQVKVLYSRIEGALRRYDQLELERSSVAFFPLSWTIVHPITEHSPLFGVSPATLAEKEAEFLVLLSAVDDTFSQTVHTRTSYRVEEVEVGAKFVNIYNPPTDDGIISIDISRLHQTEPAPLGEGLPGETATWHSTGHFASWAPPRRPAK